MRKIFILILLMLPLVACNQGEENGPEAIPTDEGAAESPRGVEPTPTPELPPTWTPEPIIDGVHLSGEEGNVGTGSGTVDVNGRTTHVIQPGDTLGKIAIQYGVTVAALAEANNITNIDVIEVGEILVIPD